MKTYTIAHQPAPAGRRGDVTATVTDGGRTYPLEHHVRHSPDGFEFGYGGSGPAELARCLLWDHLGKEPTPGCYQDFKWRYVGPAPSDGFVLTGDEVAAWVETWRSHHHDGQFATVAESDDWLMADLP